MWCAQGGLQLWLAAAEAGNGSNFYSSATCVDVLAACPASMLGSLP
jgi:hypothetical protein